MKCLLKLNAEYEAAKLGIPCIGLAQQREQVWLWPELSLEKPDPMMAAELGRQMLTGQGVAADLCLGARQRLAGALTPVNNGPTLGSEGTPDTFFTPV